MNRKNITQLIASLLILLFSYAATSKLVDYQTFVIQLGKSPLIDQYAIPISWGIPSLEYVVVALLLFSRSRLLGFYASFFLMMLFTVYIYAILHFSYDLPCSCGGVLSQLSWQQHLIFNIAFTILSLFGIIFQSPYYKNFRLSSLNILLRSKQESR
ncbi:MAG: hypothetical protein J7623_16280 [Chitinophaga sp.]|uniref:MauE/DoxX family redox-associated membrane protein n=1 Tax=Chitinophaga sp. TaxID=1869181 RepID=UPI001B2A0200|nr:MauE/DoxX family redox-associated membrane protein [Chitinophaga sp.]MBO9730198.1 hypothetical protein [Chitinophaga sp.]